MNDESYFRYSGQVGRVPEKNYLYPKTTHQHDNEKAFLRRRINELEEENARLKGNKVSKTTNTSKPNKQTGRRRRGLRSKHLRG